MAEPVLLTGATGFVGRAVLAELLGRGVPVVAVSRRPGAALPGVTWVAADLLTPAGRAAVAGLAPRLIHCAWEVEHGAFWTSPANEAWRAASVDLVARFRAAGGGRVLVTGTCAEYDATAPGDWDEGRRIAPATPYGRAKAALHAALGPDVIWARLFHLFGPGEDPRRLVPALFAALSRGEVAEVRAASLVRDYASSALVARCLVALIEAGAAGAYDIGAGQPVSLGALGQVIAGLLGRTDLLRLSDQPGQGPLRMAPRLQRLHAAIGVQREDLRLALAGIPR